MDSSGLTDVMLEAGLVGSGRVHSVLYEFLLCNDVSQDSA